MSSMPEDGSSPHRCRVIKRTSASITGLALALYLILMGIAPATAAPRSDWLDCGATITTDTVLQQDLTNCISNGVVIGADNITLDLNGHAIAGDSTMVQNCPDEAICDRGVDNSQGHDGVTIKNGTIKGFNVGLWVVGAKSNRVRNLFTSDNGFLGILVIDSDKTQLIGNHVLRNGVGNDGGGLGLVGSQQSQVLRNVISGNGSQGLQAIGGSDHNVIAFNRVTENPEAGVGIDGNGNRITQNWVSQNGDDIIVTGDDNLVRRNVVSDAVGCPDGGCGYGISLEHGVGNRITRNLVTDARTGIRVDAFEADAIGTVIDHNVVRGSAVDGVAVNLENAGTVADTRISRNVVSGSGDDGIDVESASTTLIRNVAVENGDLGIEAIPGVTDGGRNRAFGNGNPAQCTGITCGN